MSANEARLINKVFVERDLYKARADEILSQLDSCNDYCEQVISSKNLELTLSKSIITFQDEVIKNDSVQIKDYDKLFKSGNNKIDRLKFQRNTLGLAVIILVVKFLW